MSEVLKEDHINKMLPHWCSKVVFVISIPYWCKGPSLLPGAELFSLVDSNNGLRACRIHLGHHRQTWCTYGEFFHTHVLLVSSFSSEPAVACWIRWFDCCRDDSSPAQVTRTPPAFKSSMLVGEWERMNGMCMCGCGSFLDPTFAQQWLV